MKELRAHQHEFAHCRKEIQVGLDQLERGKVTKFDMEDVISRGRQRTK